MTQRTKIVKYQDERQIVVAEIYAPMITDTHGDFMTADEIADMAYGFMKSGRLDQVDIGHDNQLYGCHVVESFIAREDDSVFIPGSWVVGVWVPSPEIWSAIKRGELNGFSMEAMCVKKNVEIDIDCPVSLSGECEKSDVGHTHRFLVHVDKEGNFTGGETDTVQGHSHKIVKGVVTEEAEGHTHRYSYVDKVDKLDD